MALTPQQLAEYSANITQQYKDILGRTPSQQEVDWYANSGKDYNTITNEFKNSQEYLNKGKPTTPGTTTPPTTGIGGGTPAPTGTTTPPPSMDMSAVTGAINGIGSTVNNNTNAAAQGINNNISGATGTINQNTNAGIAALGQNVNQGLSTVNQNLGTVQTNVNANTNQGIAGVTDKLNTGFGNTATGFTDNKNLLTQIGGDLKSQLANAQTALLSGQTGMGGKLDQIGTKQDTYYGGLSKQATDLQGSVTGIGSGLNNYYEDYGKDQTRQTQANARIEGGIAGGFNNMQSQMQRAPQQSASLATGVGGAQATSPDAQAQTQSVMANTAKSIFMGAPVASQNDIAARQSFVSGLNNLRNMSAQNPELGEFVGAFDPSGKLIPDGMDAQGMRVARAIDGTGNLVVARLTQQGQMVAQQSYNMDQVLGMGQTPYQVN